MRDFEQEYKNYINEDVPDLWDRIEPNLKEKPVSIDDIKEKSDEKKSVNTKNNKNKQSNIIRISKTLMQVAACFAVLGICVTIYTISRNSKNMSAPTSDAYSESAAETAESFAPVSEDVSGAAEEYVTDEVCDAEEAYMEENDECVDMATTEEAASETNNITKDIAEESATAKPSEGSKLEILSGVEICEVIDAPANLQEKGYICILECAYASALTETSTDQIEKFYVVVPEEVVTEIVMATGITYNMEVEKTSEILKSSDLSDYQALPLYMLVSMEKNQ